MPPKLLTLKMLVYDETYKKAQAVLVSLNPCNIHKDGEGKMACVGHLKSCCLGCKHLTPSGCGVQSLSCKLYLCHVALATEAGKQAAPQLQALGQGAREEVGYLGWRSSREDKEAELKRVYLPHIGRKVDAS